MSIETSNLILNLIKKYASNQKLPDSNFIAIIINTLIKEYNLTNYLKNINILAKPIINLNNKPIYINYTSLSSTLNISLNTLNNLLINSIDITYFKDISKYYYLLFTITALLFHEIEHVKQIKKSSLNKPDLETKIIIYRNSFLELLKNINEENEKEVLKLVTYYQKIYCQNHDLDPLERLAEINSNCLVLKLLEQIPNIDPKLLTYFKINIYKSLILGYNKSSNPTKLFFSKLDLIDKWDEIESLTTDLTPLQSLAYGLYAKRNITEPLLIKKRSLEHQFLQ